MPLNTYSAAEVQDQNDGCLAPTGGDSLSDVTKFPMYQVFSPSLNRLTKIKLLFGGTNNPSILMTIKDTSGNQLNQTSAIAGAGWIDFTLASPLTVTPGLSYQISLTREATALISWNYCQPASYSGGYAVTGGTIIPDKDYNFQTYGYNQAAPTPSAGPTIEPPKNLSAEDVAGDDGGKIKLIFEKSSTSGVDGYRIYRRTETEKELEQIVELGPKELEFEDSNLENGVLYIYVARAYKDNSESVDSNEARAEPINNLAPKTPENLKVKSKDINYIELGWDKVDDERLDKYVIRYGEDPNNYTEEKEVSKDVSYYRALNLKPNTRYYFRIASKSKEGEVSGFSDFISEMTNPEKKGISWVWIVSIIVLLLAGFGIYLYFAKEKKWWPFGKRNPKSQIQNPKQIPNQNIQNEKTDDDIKELSGKRGKW